MCIISFKYKARRIIITILYWLYNNAQATNVQIILWAVDSTHNIICFDSLVSKFKVRISFFFLVKYKTYDSYYSSHWHRAQRTPY